MKFYDRQQEIAALKQIEQASRRAARFTVVVGRRRIGKTALLLEAYGQGTCLYLFVSRQGESLLCRQFQKEAESVLGLRIFGEISSFADLFEQLLRYSMENAYTLIIDEFQELEWVNPAIFGQIQDLWDRYKDKSKMNFVACGSIYSLMMRIFESRKEPLFGRLDSKFRLQAFTTAVQKEVLHDYNPDFQNEDLLCLYLLTGGVPKYVSLLMDAGCATKEKMLGKVFSLDSPFLFEGRDLLVSEFGRSYGVYFSILQLIAAGKTSQAEIDSVIGKNTGTYLANLENEYSLIVRNKPVFSRPNARRIRWEIQDNYLRFWFRFIYPNQHLIEMQRLGILREIVENQYEQYSGHVLEQYFRQKLFENERITEIGRFWNRKGENEIDIVAVNALDKRAIVAEVKRNPQKISIPLLQRKAESLLAEMAACRIEYRGYSLEDM